MNADLVPTDSWVLAPSSILRPRCSGSTGASEFPPSSVRLGSSSWLSPLVSLVVFAAFPAVVSAAPSPLRPRDVVDAFKEGLSRRDSNNSSNGSISMTVWLPILVVTVVFALFSFCTCVRRRAANDAATRANRPGTSTAANRNTAGTATTTRPRRRPQRTASQISTKSLPPYMKEPGEQELVLFRGPEESEDDHALPHAMPILAEDDEEHTEAHNGAFGIALDRMESVDTMADSSTTDLIHRASASVPRPPELHHATMPHHHRQSGDANSLDSVGSEAELLAHQRAISTDSHPDPRGEAPSYTEAVVGRMATVFLNDPDPINDTASTPAVPPPSHSADATAGRGHSRFSFLLHNPFSSRINVSEVPSNASTPPDSTRSESPALHAQAGSAISRFPSRESHETHHSRAPSRNGNVSHMHSRSNSNLFRAFRSHSPGPHPGSSTISLDSISAPLTHTVKRAEFHAPKGGFLTPEQVKLITSREAVDKFGVPYGPDAIAAYSLSREGPPPEFASVAGGHPEEASGSDSGSEAAVGTTAQTMGAPGSGTASQFSLSHQTGADATAYESDGDEQPSQAQSARAYVSDESGSGGVDELRTAQPLTPSTARPLSLSSRMGGSNGQRA